MLELDDDGYPTEETLAEIREWKAGDGWGLLEAVADIWFWPTYADINRQSKKAELSTGGWSGNEDVISAMQDNISWWTLHWYSIVRGGHYTFRPLDVSESSVR